MYRCFVCGASGGTIDLVMNYLGVTFLEACRWLEEGTGGPSLSLPMREGMGSHSERKVYSFDASRYERFFERPYLNGAARRFLYDERRIDERVVRWCRLTSWTDRHGVDWLQIPYYDREGKLVGIQNRNLGADGCAPRFRFPTGSRCSIYNLPVLGLLRPGEELYITEGASDCWAMLSSGHKAIAIPSATLLNPQDIGILTTLASELSTTFHMYPDRDEPGERLFLQLKEILPGIEHHQLPVGCKDYGDMWRNQNKNVKKNLC